MTPWAPSSTKSTHQFLDDFAAGQATFIETVEAFGVENWTALGESPIGHVPARLVLAHALWNSWVHERDVFAPLGRPSAFDADEVFDSPIDVQIDFDDVPDRALQPQVDRGVRLGSGDQPAVRVSALDLVESATGRGGGARSIELLPSDLRTHVERGQQIF